MKTILQKLYLGELDPTMYFQPKGVQYWREDEEVEKILKKWAKQLGEEEEIALFDDMLTIYLRMAHLAQEEMFQYGFHLAIKLIFESLSSELHEKVQYINK